MNKIIIKTLFLISFFCTHSCTECAADNPRFATFTVTNQTATQILLYFQSQPTPPEHTQTTHRVLKIQPAESKEMSILTDLQGKAILHEIEEYGDKFRVTRTAILDTTQGNTLNICDTQDNAE
jgi:hypothetical protein